MPRAFWNLTAKLRMPTQSSGLNAGAFFTALPRMRVIVAMTAVEIPRAFGGLRRDGRNGAYRVEYYDVLRAFAFPQSDYSAHMARRQGMSICARKGSRIFWDPGYFGL